METNLNRNEKVLALVFVGAILGFVALFLQINFRSNASVSQIDNGMQVNYTMARPEEGYSEYSLNGREIDHAYEGLVQKQQANKATAAKTAAAKPKTAAEKKAEDIKKKAEQAQKATALARSQAQARYQAQVAEQARQKALAEQRSRSNAMTTDHNGSPSPASDSPSQGSGVTTDKTSNPNDPAVPEDLKKNKKTYAQWRSQIFAQPTRENISAFLEAHRKGEITSTEVQAMAQDLLDQNDENLKGLGLYTLRSTPSLASLSQLVHVQAQVNATYKTYVDQALLAYLQPQNVGYLNQALQTKDKTLIAKTLSLLSTNLPNVAKGNSAAILDPRSGRMASASSSTITMNSFTSLLPALNSLASSQDQDFTSVAQQVISYIQSANTVAQN